MEIKKRTYTPEQALNRLMMHCSKAEKCTSDAVALLYRWNVGPAEHTAILKYLTDSRYIDDSRYAEAYVRDKANYSGWGTGKIVQGLRLKRIPQTVIDKAIGQIGGDIMSEKMERVITAKLQKVRARSRYELKGKLMQFGLSRGFDYDILSDTVDRLISGVRFEDGED